MRIKVNDSVAMSFASILALFVTVGCPMKTPSTAITSGAAAAESAAFPIKVTIDMGVMIQGESSKTNRWLRNPSDRLLNIAKIESSCDCIEIQVSKSQVGPADRTLLRVTHDGTKEPDFVGSLQVEVKLFDRDGGQIAIIQVPMEVISKAAGSAR